jgi:spore coat protein CotH
MNQLSRLFLPKILLFLLALLQTLPALSQNFTDSNLPIVIINTDIDPNTGQPIQIPDEPKVLGNMKIIFRPDGSRNYVTDQGNPQYLNYDGRIGIEIRGSSSQELPKKSYGFTTLQADNVSNNNVPLLGMPKENDWILNSFAFDPSLMRDYISYQLSNDIGAYATKAVYCEVMVNGNYRGLYILMEKIKIDKDRLNLVKLTNSDNSMPNISGGYITKADKTTGGDPIAWSMPSYSGGWVDYIHDNPKPENVTSLQNNYIRQVFFGLQSVASAQNASPVNGYPSMIDIPSFLDFMLINELTSNVDAYQYSTFFHKDRGGKLRAGPVWDLNLTFGNDLFIWGFDRSHPDVWQFNYENRGSKFWKDLFDHPDFKCYLAKRWNEFSETGEALHYSTINTLIDLVADTIAEARIREEQRWGTIGNHPVHIADMKSWIQTRINWLNAHLNNYQGCANPSIPALVISKIHYHPDDEQGISNEEDLEFIEITNASNQTVDLTGVYLREPGIGFQFSPDDAIAPGQAIFIVSNIAVFEQLYGFTPFGEYYRYLSNKSHKLLLADAWGNTIDEVTYKDDTPWPPQADGDGPYLKLISLDLDNSLPESWEASAEQLVHLDESRILADYSISPNPSKGSLVVKATHEIVSVEVLDLLGNSLMKTIPINTRNYKLNTNRLAAGTYFLQAVFADGTVRVKKVIIL